MKPGGLDRKLGLATLFSAIDSTLTSLQALGAAAGAWLDLAIRFWLAKAFLTETVVSMAMHTPVTMSFATGIAPTINALVASPFGAVVAALCPMLLIIGLCSRIAALPLLFEACALHGLDGPSPLHLYWALLLGWIIVRAPVRFRSMHCCRAASSQPQFPEPRHSGARPARPHASSSLGIGWL
jgi:hypothetical protein